MKFRLPIVVQDGVDTLNGQETELEDPYS